MKRALIALLVLAACGGPAATPIGTPAVTVQMTAKDLLFDKATFSVPADLTFAVELDNRDAAPHNVAINGNGQSRGSEPFSGPATRTYVFAALPAGSYSFICSVHPEMRGVVDVVAATGSVR